ncbi:dipeptide epimerase [Aureimonas flava]|uniref:Dipeptide epimerase n=1 Tax=Aureimonas flava TaxID=2320271 RepID=A0A3A1WYK4_9HYPH|nr:N-acetyl-D-Glu racemase DgcA [Aureimonas flava]RIY03829.1 dipeptide epimerase [Aureimonas flava]
MPRRLSVTVDRFPLARRFTIARGSKTEAVVVVCTLDEGAARGRGECVPYARYGESVESVCAAIEGARSAVEAGATRQELQDLLPAGAARNALDCAFWDLEAKRDGDGVARRLGIARPRAVDTAFTISLDTADEMHRAAAAVRGRSVLKVKVGGPEGDAERMRAVRAAAPGARLIIDANEGWRPETIRELMLAAAGVGAAVVEQPLPAGQDEMLARMPRPVPVCADESVHGSGDLASLVGRYDYVNLKLDKTGGLTEGLRFLREARRLGFGVMAGCMVGSSLAMAPAVLLAQEAELCDLDGPLLLAEDRADGLAYEGSTVGAPSPALWG